MPMTAKLRYIARSDYQLVVDPSAPHWLATNDDGTRVIRQLRAGRTVDEISYRYAKSRGIALEHALRAVRCFADEVTEFVFPPPGPAYEGRARYLRPGRLREVWFHVTDQCNLTCRHCLVSSGPAREDGLPRDELCRAIRQAADLGADTYYFTGGEPLLRPDMPEILREVTASYRATAVVMTNGTLLDAPLIAELSTLPRSRLFLQISLDGSCAERNDPIRSPGSFDAAMRGIRAAMAAGLQVTVATVVLRQNLDDLPPLAEGLAQLGVRQVHLMWQHVRERGGQLPRAPVSQVLRAVTGLSQQARETGLVIDNLENVRRMADGEPGVKRDLSNACWDSLAVYRDGRVFPSACLVGIDSESPGSLRHRSLRELWLASDLFVARREQSVIHAGLNDDPLLFLHGGGDPDQTVLAGRDNGRAARDPYLSLHRALTLTAIDDAVAKSRALIGNGRVGPVVYRMMGEDGYGCPTEAGVKNGGAHRVDFVHSNCVLTQDVVAKARAEVKHYYGQAAREPKAEICSPVRVERGHLAHIPQEVVARSYGCGSPVLLAAPQPGEVVLDLGSGAGLECFIAARLVGARGRVIGIDMTESMLAFAEQARMAVAGRLGYDNVQFRRGYLEALPVSDASADAAISNCVINLSPEKLRVLAEIRRVLKPGGRAVISDIVSERPLPPEVRFNPRLRGECIAGAMTERKLLRTLEKLGFEHVEVLAKTAWRVVEGVPFHSLTVRATKPAAAGSTPPPAVTSVPAGSVLEGLYGSGPQAAFLEPLRHSADCLVCGAPLVYLEQEELARCHYCGEPAQANARCERGHFVCDRCHVGDRLSFVKSFCARSVEADPMAVFFSMRRTHLFPVHGPEHHALVPAAFLTAYRNRFGDLPQARIDAAIDRAAALPGGTCGYWGACAAALGIGVAYGTILRVTPLSYGPRGVAQQVVSRILAEIGRLPAPRCCRRESVLALRLGCELSAEYLPHTLLACASPPCDQVALNRECIGEKCPVR
jgi:MoaA/NifB/PqqE/SkfB family radical SAM enzyme/SAM-dependent methyltransferase